MKPQDLASIVLGSTVDKVVTHEVEGLQSISLHLTQPTEEGEWSVELKIEPDGNKGLLIDCSNAEWTRTHDPHR